MRALSKTKPTSKRTARSKPYTTPKEKFQYYWDRIQKAEKAYAAAERQRTRLMDTFNDTMLPLEQHLCQIREQYIQTLLSFSDKKTLPFYLKEELLEWVSDEYAMLMSSPFRGSIDTDALLKSITESSNAMMEQSARGKQFKAHQREALREEIDGIGFNSHDFEDEDIDVLLNVMQSGPHLFLEKLMQIKARIEAEKRASHTGEKEQQGKEGDDSIDEESSDDEDAFFNDFFNDAFGFSPEDDMFKKESFTNKQDVLSKKSINTFYKKIAQRIHPDKAKNEQDRETRNHLMQVLTTAKKENDAFTIFNLYQEHVDGDDFSFSDEEFEVLISLLEDKLRILRNQKRNLKQDNGIDAIVYQRFHAKNKQETNARMASHKASLQDAIAEITNDIKHTRTLKQLKEKLNDRISETEVDDLFSLML